MSTFHQTENHNVSVDISLMEWNPTLDLIALSTTTGEVLLHRLSWQKVWSVPTCDSVVITSMAWRPDGKILAYGHNNGKVILCDVESSEIVHTVEAKCAVTSLIWVQCVEDKESLQNPIYIDRSDLYLMKHYTCSDRRSEEAREDFRKMKGQNELNILAIGMETGIVHLHSFGMFPTGVIDVNIDPDDPVKSKVLSIALSKDFRILTVLLEKKEESDNCYYYRSYHMPLLSDRMQEIKIVSLKYGQICSLLTYLSHTMRAISDQWKDILMELDTKFHNYALEKENDEATISDDFLELLAFGNPSDSLEKFLLSDLTEDGLKKLGHSIELAYSNIQKLVMKTLQSLTSSLYYHLNEFEGMAACEVIFDGIGLDEKAIHEAAMMTGSFLRKATEVQQVIDNSMTNFKAFFRWLYSAILRLSGEPIPAEVRNLTQQDLQFVQRFLKENFVEKVNKEGRKTTVKLERVAQYLKKEDLQYPASTDGNPWIKFLEKHPCIQEAGLISKNYPKKSLVTLYEDMCKVIDNAVNGTWNIFGKTVTPQSFHYLFRKNEASRPKISHIACNATGSTYTLVTNGTPPCSGFVLLKEHSKTPGVFAVAVKFEKSQESIGAGSENKNFKVLDVKFYNEEIISVLLMEDENPETDCPALFQLPLRCLIPELKLLENSPKDQIPDDINFVNAIHFMEDGNYKVIENAKVEKMAVSGSRKVVCVLFTSKREVRLFVMDGDEETADNVGRVEAKDSDEEAKVEE